MKIETHTEKEYIYFDLHNGMLYYKPDTRFPYTELYFLSDIDKYIEDGETTKDLSYFTSCFMDVIGKAWWEYNFNNTTSNYTSEEILKMFKEDFNKELCEDLVKLLWAIIPYDHFYYGRAIIMMNSLLNVLELTDSEINKRCKMEYKLSKNNDGIRTDINLI